MQETNIGNNQKAKKEDNFLDKIVNNQLDVDTDDLVFQLGQDAVHKLDWDKKKNKLISYIQSLNNALNEKVKESEENKNNINKINELNTEVESLNKQLVDRHEQVKTERKVKQELSSQLNNTKKEHEKQTSNLNELNTKIKELEETIGKRDSSIKHITQQISEEKNLKHSALERENGLKEENLVLKSDLKEKDDEIAEYVECKNQLEKLEKEIERRDKISKSKKNFKKIKSN